MRVVARYLGLLCRPIGISTAVPVAGAIVLGEARLALPHACVRALLLAAGWSARRGAAPTQPNHGEALAVAGLGFVVMSLGLLAESGMASHRLGPRLLSEGDVVGSSRQHAREVLSVYFVLTLVGVLSLVAFGAAPFDALGYGLAAISTGGFAPRDSSLAELSLMPAMLIGGSHGSTAGGIKLLRVLMVLGAVRWILVRVALPPHAVWRPRIQGKPVELVDMQRAVVIALLFGLVACTSTVPFIAMGYDPLDSAFDVVSALGTVGPSTGITSRDLPSFLKLVLCAHMLLGRVEILALVVFLSPRPWIRRRIVRKRGLSRSANSAS